MKPSSSEPFKLGHDAMNMKNYLYQIDTYLKLAVLRSPDLLLDKRETIYS